MPVQTKGAGQDCVIVDKKNTGKSVSSFYVQEEHMNTIKKTDPRQENPTRGNGK